MTHGFIDHDSDEWARARVHVTERRAFGTHLVAYVVVNAALVAISAMTGSGYFGPGH